MKILLINNFHYRFGGASVVYLNSAEILEKQGHKVVFFSFNDDNNISTNSEKYFIDRKIQVGQNNNKAKNVTDYFYNKQAAKRLEILLKEEKPDIAHIHLFIGGITPSILPVLKKYAVPIVYTAHDYRLICPAYTFLDGKGSICEACAGENFYNCALKKCSKGDFLQSVVMMAEMYYRNAFFNSIKYIDGFCFVSNFAKNKHLQYMPKLKSKETTVLFNFCKYKNDVFENKDSYFLYYGRISSEKGLITLLAAFKYIKHTNLKIVGSGSQLDILREYVIKNKINNIEFLGFKSGAELTDLVSNAYFVIVPSEWYENNPMTIVESYSYGTPVIGANIGGIPEIISDGETGYIFTSRDKDDLIDKIEKSLSISKDKYNSLRVNAYKFASEYFNENTYYKNLMDFYTAIIQNYSLDKNK